MRAFAIIPAAGRSQRMGQPKLLLPWKDGTLIEHVLSVWLASRVERVVLVVHPADERIAQLGRSAGADVVRPDVPPAEMKASIQLALTRLQAQSPGDADAWLLAPADMPNLRANVINQVIAAGEQGSRLPPRIVVPCRGGRRGHPVLFPWSLAGEVGRVGANEGVNVLLSRHLVEELDVQDDAILEDIDTPAEYERFRRHEGS